jgi:hypothetical protein
MREWLQVAMVAGLVWTGPVMAADAERFDGRPAFTEGSDRGYFVWRDGDTWHVRWTTQGAMRRFTGSVTAEGGELKSLKRIDVEEERRVVAPGRPGHLWRGPHGRLHVGPGHAPVVAERKQDKIEKDGDARIFWISRTDADLDGFDFKVDRDVTRLRFALEVDGESRAAQVELGRANAHPERNPFGVDLR